MEIDNSFSAHGQNLAIAWLEHYLRQPLKVDFSRQEGEGSPAENRPEHARAVRLQLGAIRHLRFLRYVLEINARKKIRSRLEALLLLALFEIWENLRSGGDNRAQIVHSWVGTAKKGFTVPEARFVNAILRACAGVMEDIRKGKRTTGAAILHSHPDWLVKKWELDLGKDEMLQLLEWNQTPPVHYLRSGLNAEENRELGLRSSRWPDFYQLEGRFTPALLENLSAGKLTVQDPATRIAVRAMVQSLPRRVLDLCASPGGKTRYLDTLLPRESVITAVDLPHKLPRLRENLEALKRPLQILEQDLRNLPTDLPEWNQAYDAVLLDAPCSNTGVIRRKPDIKWRLRPEDLCQLSELQDALLSKAAECVAPGGILVYSTCSLEREENGHRVKDFLASELGQQFSLQQAIHARPIKSGHDGAGVFQLKKRPLL